jgi:hypothetical protein
MAVRKPSAEALELAAEVVESEARRLDAFHLAAAADVMLIAEELKRRARAAAKRETKEAAAGGASDGVLR